MKQALKLILVTLTLLATPPASSIRSISNARAHLYTTSITPEDFTANKHKKPFALL